MIKNLKYLLLTVILFPLVGMVSSCSDETETEGEFDNWQQKNEAMIDQWATNSAYRKILTYTKNDDTPGLTNSDYIYVEVLEQGSGTESPLYTDTVRLAYRGRLLPSVSYPEGYVFDETFSGDFDWKTVGVYTNSTTGVDRATAGSWMEGFTTALQNMHKGDYWRVYIPYDLMYGSASSTSYPAYSNMIFDIALVDVWHPGETRPVFKSRSF